VIPKRFREGLREGLALVPWAEKTLAILPLKTYHRWEKDILSTSIRSEEGRKLRRLILGNAYLLEMDKQGRVMIPPPLKALAEIGSEVALTGSGDYLEICGREGYEASLRQEYEDYGRYLEKLGG
jgi:MraZ protein